MIVSQLLIVEATSAFNRRRRDADIALADYRRMIDAFRDDCLTAYQVLPINETIVDLACELLERHPLRASDAIHLATALTSNRLLLDSGLAALTFLCADARLLNAAIAEGLGVDNPNLHP
ncbi:MAG: type II toxin-antitoxin system VapC family toxin [Anaerolineae bacterium]